MSNYLVLRDIPKHLIQVDKVQMQINGGFRGFRSVPDGLHYIGVTSGDDICEMWCYLRGGSVLMRVFDDERLVFEAETPQSDAEYRQIALSGAMAHTLLEYPLNDWESWQSLTGAIVNHVNHISDADYPDYLLSAMQDGWQVDISRLVEKSRFEQLLSDHHGGQGDTLQAAFQFAFVHWLLSHDPEQENMALDAWREMLLALYGCGESIMRQHPVPIGTLAAALLAQLDYLPDSFFDEDAFVMQGLDEFINDLMDTHHPILSKSGAGLRAYLAAAHH